MSEMLTVPLSLKSGGQALVPQCRAALVPTKLSILALNPSQSASLAGTGHCGSAWVVFGHAGQLSQESPTVSASPSAWASFAMVGQLSQASPRLSVSLFVCEALATSGQLSVTSSTPSLSS